MLWMKVKNGGRHRELQPESQTECLDGSHPDFVSGFVPGAFRTDVTF